MNLQGLNEEYDGASYTFGCSWSMYFDGCKYGKGGIKSNNINKFRLAKEADDKEESDVAENMHRLADIISPLYKRVAPKSYQNMTGMYFVNKTRLKHLSPQKKPFLITSVDQISDLTISDKIGNL